ncbi:MAG: hypothetical protein JXR96_22910 [Deltaproteobacteria bacterium]|nr:hypothetical protein [Deltaproteobacteria bacterium]
MSDDLLYRIRGRAFQREAEIEIHADRVRYRVIRGQVHPEPEQGNVPIGSLRVFALSCRSWTGASSFGLVLVGLSVLWQVYGSISLPVALAIGLAGGLGILIPRAFPQVWLTLRAADAVVCVRVARGSVGACEQAVRRLQGERPELAGASPGRLLPFMGRQLAVLFASEQALREEIRRAAGPGIQSPEQESRALGIKRRLAAWFALWLLVLPLGGALAVQAVLPPQPPLWLGVRIGLWFFMLLVACSIAQAWLWKRALGWMLGQGRRRA